MTTRAAGNFDVNLIPQPPDDQAQDPTLGRIALDKQFHGDLEATSKGQMLSAMTSVKGSAGYVALERVVGTLHGRGAPQLGVTVVPDSGTDQLQGLAGKMTINVDDGKHSYEFEYSLDETA